MIGTGKKLRITAIRSAHAVAAMAAKIQVPAKFSRPVTTENNRLFSHVAHNKIAGIGNFAFMAQIKPAAREQAFTLELVNLSVGKNPPVDETAFWVDQRLDIHSRRLLRPALQG
jgi:hypothetical protein